MLDRCLRAIRRHRQGLARSLLVAALAIATWPAWRVALLGSEPTFEELLQFACGIRR